MHRRDVVYLPEILLALGAFVASGMAILLALDTLLALGAFVASGMAILLLVEVGCILWWQTRKRCQDTLLTIYEILLSARAVWVTPALNGSSLEQFLDVVCAVSLIFLAETLLAHPCLLQVNAGRVLRWLAWQGCEDILLFLYEILVSAGAIWIVLSFNHTTCDKCSHVVHAVSRVS